MPHSHLKVVPAPAQPCQDTIAALESLLQQARSGEVTGLCYVVLKHGTDYTGDVTGRAREIPVLACGLIRTLQAKVEKLL